MFDTMLPASVYAKVVKDKREVDDFLRAVYADNDDERNGDLPYVRNEDELPTFYPCILGVQWREESFDVAVSFVLDLTSLSRMTYELCKAGAKLSDVR